MIPMGLNGTRMKLIDCERKTFQIYRPEAELAWREWKYNRVEQHSLFFYNYEIENQSPKRPVN
jgi:hypothetical protein